ncbi:hypothetical protein T12_8200 [Trichinella patagoniensis]|uniref:Uncharacterized protein n=1 Tax=Trichinella patagoniensis TaxID=990121 RepID=A0A0V1A1Y2_9BILA|nr:hypothetical protein T12_5230 [Trichinella patagoniensis]KRY18935.1 hypothetical protein T12_8200 [Trichinella patagoniensis]
MKKKSKSIVDAERNADGMMQNNKREKTAFERTKLINISHCEIPSFDFYIVLRVESISIALKPLLMLLALPLSIKHISINRKSHFLLAKQAVTCKLFN